MMLKISNISFGNKNNSYQTEQRNLFIKLLNESVKDGIPVKECDVFDEKPVKIQAKPSVQVHFYPEVSPLGRDLVVKKPVKVKPKSFDKSDKLLVLDKYQKDAVEQFRNGNNVMVTAPTGTGKTLIAEHIIDDILKSGKKVIYTTPLKALCNDKYKQFSFLWGDYDEKGNLIGSSKVGLATGDVKLNVNAPIVVMTTEIYRNMLVQHGEKDVEKELKDVDAVIFDEFHYMGDAQRGAVWEESLMFSPQKLRHLMLSATISNAKPIVAWLNSINPNHKSVIVDVPEEERHVPLKYYAYSSIAGNLVLDDLLSEHINLESLKNKKLSSREQEVLDEIAKMFKEKDGISAIERVSDFAKKIGTTKFAETLVKYGMPHSKAEQFALRLSDKTARTINTNLSKIETVPMFPVEDLVRSVEKRKMSPALYFVYSKKNCKNLMKECSDKIGQLLTDEERLEVQKRINEIKKKGIFLGTNFEKDIEPCLLNGFSMHHSGMLPQCKSFIEELGRSKLIKFCFATDTLGAGINFPFRTVIFSDFEKYSDGGFEEISTNSFKQGAGRAGRRNKDQIGYVIALLKDKNEAVIPYNKIINESDEIKSAFDLSYGLVLSPRFLNNSSKVLNNSFVNYQEKNCDDKLKKSNLMKEILEERGFIEKKNGIFRVTKKGKIATNIRGVNEILLTEMLCNNKIVENISPADLATIISMFSPDRDNDNVLMPGFSNDSFNKRIEETIKLSSEIKEQEGLRGIESGISRNTSCMPYVKLWANSSNSEESIILWQTIVESALAKNAIKTEGDFLKKINFTINVLKQICKAAPSQYLKDTASKAIKLLQKSPVNDILLYELDYKNK